MKAYIIPIMTSCCGTDEVVTPEGFAEHVPTEFSMLNYVKNKNIKRCYIIFYDTPEQNEFLKDLKVVFNFHAGSTVTKVFEYKNNLIAISPLGGPAAANLMEEISIFGINEFIAIGSAGCLDSEIKDKFVFFKGEIWQFLRRLPEPARRFCWRLSALVLPLMRKTFSDMRKALSYRSPIWCR